MEGVVGATTVVGVALLTEEAGGDTALNEGEQFKTFSLAYIHAPSPYYGDYFRGAEDASPTTLQLVFIHLMRLSRLDLYLPSPSHLTKFFLHPF